MNGASHRVHVIPPPVLLLAFLIAGALAHNHFPVWIAPYPFRAGLLAGCAMLFAALTLGGWAIAEVLRHKTTIEPGHQPSRLVVSGPYRFTRNPMYVALLLISLALAAMVNSLWMIVSTLLLLAVLDRAVIAGEERLIDRAFGEEYASYRRRVRRWI